jgi:quercetin dioxygenase-like cupin family protein
MSSETAAARTPGAKRAGPGEYLFDLARVNNIMGGPAYSTAQGAVVEGERMIVGLMRMAAGTGAAPHSHPNEQWIYIIEGLFEMKVGDTELEAFPGSVVYIPSNVVHSGQARPPTATWCSSPSKTPRTACTASRRGKKCRHARVLSSACADDDTSATSGSGG